MLKDYVMRVLFLDIIQMQIELSVVHKLAKVIYDFKKKSNKQETNSK